jgi:hypothetical protein
MRCRQTLPTAMLLLLASILGGCGGGGGASEPVSPPPKVLAVVNDRFQLPTAADATLRPLANDSDSDGAALTLSIVEQPLVGQVTVNADQSVTLGGMDPTFRGLNRFKYRATAARGDWKEAYVLVFVDTTPFRAVFFTGTPEDPRISVSDFMGPLVTLPWGDPATPIVAHLPSANGGSIAFSRGTAQVSDHEVCVATLSANAVPRCHRYSGQPQYTRFTWSPDARWLVVMARSSTSAELWLLEADNASATPVLMSLGSSAPHAQFSTDSQRLYFSGDSQRGGTGHGIFRMPLSGTLAAQKLSADIPGFIGFFRVSPDETRLAFVRVWNATEIWRLDPRSPAVEQLLSHPQTQATHIQYNAAFTNVDVTAVTYLSSYRENGTTRSAAYMAKVADAPDPHIVRVTPAGDVQALSATMRPDGRAILVTQRHYDSGLPEINYRTVHEVTDEPGASAVFVAQAVADYHQSGNYLAANTWSGLFDRSVSYLGVLTRTDTGFVATTLNDRGMQTPDTSNFSRMHMGQTSLLFQQEEISWNPPTPRRPGTEFVLVNLSVPDARLVIATMEVRPRDGGMFLVDAP